MTCPRWTSRVGATEECYTPVLPPVELSLPDEWVGYSSRSLEWDDIGFYYDGNSGGCNECVRNIRPSDSSTWSDGLSLSSIEITVRLFDAAGSSKGPKLIVLSGENYEYEYSFQDSVDSFSDPGTYDLRFEIVDGHHPEWANPGANASLDTGFSEVSALGMWFGKKSDGSDRPFRITKIKFNDYMLFKKITVT